MEAGSSAHAARDEFPFALGLAVQLVRKVYALSHDEVAQGAQLRTGDVLAIEEGVEDVPLSVVFSIADGLGIRTSGLLRIAELILVVAHEPAPLGAIAAPHQ